MAKNTRRRIVITVVVAAALGFVSCALWNLHVAYRPLPPVPVPVMPKPNAFDIYAAAAKLRVEDDTVAYAFGLKAGIPPGMVITPAQIDASGRANLPAIAMLRRAFAYSYLGPPMRSFNHLTPYYAKDRSLARILAFEGRVGTVHGAWDRALEYDVDACRLGSDLPRGAGVIGGYVGYACQAIGRRHAWDMVNHVSAPVAQFQADRMYGIAYREIPASQTLQEEAWATQASLTEYFKKPDWRKELAGDEEFERDPDPSWERPMKLLFVSPTTVEHHYVDYMNAYIAIQRLPYPASLAAKQPALPSDPMCQILIPVLTKFRVRREENVAFDYLLATQLALRAYKLGHGVYPATLNALTPAYLPAVPVDPFTDGKPLTYRLSSKGYVLYSLGPDCKDDGGTPMVNPSATTPLGRFGVRDDEKGDIVAGINY